MPSVSLLLLACGLPTGEPPRRIGMATTATQVIDGATQGGDFGAAIAGGGDHNGDGYADLIIGEPEAGGGGVHLYAGGPRGFSELGLPYAGPNSGDGLGTVVRAIGDVNGDGLDDAIASAPDFDAQRGLVAVFLGDSEGLRSSENYYPSETGELFGLSMDPLGDTDGDGNPDVAIGAPSANTGRGEVVVFLSQGGPFSSSQIGRIEGPDLRAMYGAAVAGAGDLNGDGLADLLIGAYGDDTATGRVEVVHGGFSPFGMQADTVLRGEALNGFFGISVDGAGDTDADGYDDALVGAYAMNAYAGRAYLWLGGPDGLGEVAARSFDGADGSQLGLVLTGLGDVDGDGFGDAAIAAPDAADGAGRVLVYAGSAEGLGPAPATVLEGEAAFDGFGMALAGPGDLDADGHAELLVGAPAHGGVGRVYIFAGAEGGIGDSDSGGTDSGGPIAAYALRGGRPSCAVAGDARGLWATLAVLVLAYSRRQPSSSPSQVAFAVQNRSVRETTR